MWAFSVKDLDDGAQERMVAAADFRGPRRTRDRIVTDFQYIVILFIGMIFCGYCAIAPSLIRNPDANKLLYGTDYAGNVCDDTNKYLYPIHKSGIGVCASQCPSGESADEVDGFDVDDKSKMICMSSEDYTDYTQADEHGHSDFDSLTPINAYKYGVCNFKYRTLKIGNRCFFRDTDVAEIFPYKLPDSKLVIFAQSFYASRLFISFSCVIGVWVVSTIYIMSVTNKTEKGQGAEAAAIRAVWIAIWISSSCIMLMGSHMWYTAAYYQELAVNPRPNSEVIALQLLAVVFWVGGAGWLWVLLRVRHYVTLGVMVTLFTDRAFDDIGATTIYWLSFFHAIVAAILCAFMTFTIAEVSSMGSNEYETDNTTLATGYRWGYREDRLEIVATFIIMFVIFWACQFLSDLLGLSISMGVAKWFFTRDKTKFLPNSMRDWRTTWRCYAGTVAYASILHTFTDGWHRFFATMDTLASAKLANQGNFGATNLEKIEQKLSRCFNIMVGFLACGNIDRFLKYTSANAYASVAMFGTNYWTSAQNSFYLIIRNKHRLGGTISVTHLIPFIGKVATTAICTAAFYLMQVMVFQNEAMSIACATLVAGLICWTITSQFFAPLGQASSTLLQCYMLDEELFVYNDNERYAEKMMHSWMNTYGGDFSQAN